MSDLNARIGAALVERLGEERAVKLCAIYRYGNGDANVGWSVANFTTGDGMLALIGAMRELGIPLVSVEWDTIEHL